MKSCFILHNFRSFLYKEPWEATVLAAIVVIELKRPFSFVVSSTYHVNFL